MEKRTVKYSTSNRTPQKIALSFQTQHQKIGSTMRSGQMKQGETGGKGEEVGIGEKTDLACHSKTANAGSATAAQNTERGK